MVDQEMVISTQCALEANFLTCKMRLAARSAHCGDIPFVGPGNVQTLNTNFLKSVFQADRLGHNKVATVGLGCCFVACQTE
jgi:hypothetical protein